MKRELSNKKSYKRMENTQYRKSGTYIVPFKFCILNANVKKTLASKSHWVVKTAKLNQPIYLKKSSILQNGSQTLYCIGREVMLLFPQIADFIQINRDRI